MSDAAYCFIRPKISWRARPTAGSELRFMATLVQNRLKGERWPTLAAPSSSAKRAVECAVVRPPPKGEHSGLARIRYRRHRRWLGRSRRRGGGRVARRKGRSGGEAQARRRLPLVWLRAIENAAQVGARRVHDAQCRALCTDAARPKTGTAASNGARRVGYQKYRAQRQSRAISRDGRRRHFRQWPLYRRFNVRGCRTAIEGGDFCDRDRFTAIDTVDSRRRIGPLSDQRNHLRFTRARSSFDRRGQRTGGQRDGAGLST